MGGKARNERGEWENGRRIDPLTDEQRQLVEDTYPIAIRYAIKYVKRWLSVDDMDDALGQAAVALCQAARNFDPDAGSWGSFWRARVTGELLTFVASRRAHGFCGSREAFRSGAVVAIASLDQEAERGSRTKGRTKTLADLVCLDQESGPVGWEIETEEERLRMARIAGAGSDRAQAALAALLTWCDCATIKSASELVGISESRVSELVSDRLREVAARRLAP